LSQHVSRCEAPRLPVRTVLQRTRMLQDQVTPPNRARPISVSFDRLGTILRRPWPLSWPQRQCARLVPATSSQIWALSKLRVCAPRTWRNEGQVGLRGMCASLLAFVRVSQDQTVVLRLASWLAAKLSRRKWSVPGGETDVQSSSTNATF